MKRRKNNSKDYRFAVLSTMSSGKSTLINALLGKEILPSENQACTGKIFEICNVKTKTTIHGLKNNEIIIPEIDIQSLNRLNNMEEIDKVKIQSEFYGIKKKIILYDTPGVNNYMNKKHEQITYEFLEKNKIKNIIYILNATQIGVNDDKKFLVDLKEIYKEKEMSIIFLLNKIDAIDSEAENKNRILKNTKVYLENIGFTNSILIPTSAQTAKILRKGINNELETRKEKIEFKTYIDSYLEKKDLLNSDVVIDKKLIGKIMLETGIKKLERIIQK